jgi:uncharacterized protein (TIGR03083 family)
MSTLADRTISALRSNHDELAALVPGLSDAQLSTTSGAAEWTVAHVLSHLGSGAEIAAAGYRAALDGAPPPGQDFPQAVWDRWDALSPREQAAGFLEHDAALVDMLESLPSVQRRDVRLDVGFLPTPLDFPTIAGMRLGEVAQHGWDVRVGLDPSATLDGPSAEVLIEQLINGLRFMVGFMGKADRLSQPAVVNIERSHVAIAIDDHVSLSVSTAEATANFSGEPEAAIRLIGGRLKPQYTPADVEVTGNVTLDDLRKVFPGY